MLALTSFSEKESFSNVLVYFVPPTQPWTPHLEALYPTLQKLVLVSIF